VPSSAPGAHVYLPTTPEKLRAHAERCRGQIADAYTQISELHDWIAHWQAEAEDFFHAAELVERDRLGSVLDATPRPGPAMGQDQLLNGVQPGFGANPTEAQQQWHREHPYDCCPEVVRTGTACAECSGRDLPDTLTLPQVKAEVAR
jgi:hypothetical protein